MPHLNLTSEGKIIELKNQSLGNFPFSSFKVKLLLSQRIKVFLMDQVQEWCEIRHNYILLMSLNWHTACILRGIYPFTPSLTHSLVGQENKGQELPPRALAGWRGHSWGRQVLTGFLQEQAWTWQGDHRLLPKGISADVLGWMWSAVGDCPLQSIWYHFHHSAPF